MQNCSYLGCPIVKRKKYPTKSGKFQKLHFCHIRLYMPSNNSNIIPNPNPLTTLLRTLKQ